MLIANFFGILLFLFLFWKKLKEDYHYEKIFNLGLISILGLTIGHLIASSYFIDYRFWFQFLGLGLGFILGIYWQKIKFFESLDALIVSILPWFSLAYLSQAIQNSSLVSFVVFWAGLFLIFVYFYLDSQYRKFIWYKSGRVGFSGLTVVSIFFALRILISNSVVESYISGAVAFVFFLLLFNLSKNKA